MRRNRGAEEEQQEAKGGSEKGTEEERESVRKEGRTPKGRKGTFKMENGDVGGDIAGRFNPYV